MDTYYEHIRSKIKGMISSSYMDLYGYELNFDLFVKHLEENYQLTESNFDYHIYYNKESNTSEKNYSNYVTLDNGIYVEIKTQSDNDIDKNIIDMSETVIQDVIAYSSQHNNNKLINFMNVVNTFIIKIKDSKDNVK